MKGVKRMFGAGGGASVAGRLPPPGGIQRLFTEG